MPLRYHLQQPLLDTTYGLHCQERQSKAWIPFWANYVAAQSHPSTWHKLFSQVWTWVPCPHLGSHNRRGLLEDWVNPEKSCSLDQVNIPPRASATELLQASKTYKTTAKSFASCFCARFTSIKLLWTTLNWTLPATTYQNGIPCQPIPSVLTLIPPLRVSCLLPLHEQPLPAPCWSLVVLGNYRTDPEAPTNQVLILRHETLKWDMPSINFVHTYAATIDGEQKGIWDNAKIHTWSDEACLKPIRTAFDSKLFICQFCQVNANEKNRLRLGTT